MVKKVKPVKVDPKKELKGLDKQIAKYNAEIVALQDKLAKAIARKAELEATAPVVPVV